MNTPSRRSLVRLASSAMFCGLVACATGEPARPVPGAVPSQSSEAAAALAVIDGVPLTRADLDAELRARKNKAKLTAEQQRAFVETLVTDELASRKALALGFGSPQLRDELARREADLAAWRRQQFSDAYFETLVANDPLASEAEARRIFETEGPRLRTEVHVWQILARDGGQIAEARRELDLGTPFEDVARKRYPTIPEGQQPWDVGYLKWKQVPDAWRAVLPQLKPGDVSDVIRGPGGRFWIIKLIERREDPGLTFEQVRDILLDDLKNDRLSKIRTQADLDLRRAATVRFSTATSSH